MKPRRFSGRRDSARPLCAIGTRMGDGQARHCSFVVAFSVVDAFSRTVPAPVNVPVIVNLSTGLSGQRAKPPEALAC